MSRCFALAGWLHPLQRDNITQNNLSEAANRGCRTFKTANRGGNEKDE